jgi:hypothetical protein
MPPSDRLACREQSAHGGDDTSWNVSKKVQVDEVYARASGYVRA